MRLLTWVTVALTHLQQRFVARLKGSAVLRVEWASAAVSVAREPVVQAALPVQPDGDRGTVLDPPGFALSGIQRVAVVVRPVRFVQQGVLVCGDMGGVSGQGPRLL